jgi:hypothetical protein
MLIPEYFLDAELACHCGCGLMPPRESVERLYALRMILRLSLLISSAARCRKQNNIAKGRINSAHLPAEKRRGFEKEWGGCGFDIIAKPMLQIKIIDAALRCGFRGFGLGKNYIHIDDAARPELTMWRYE